MNIFSLIGRKTIDSLLRGAMPYGKQKKDGSHDHRFNCGDDRTPAQKAGDQKPDKAKPD